MFLLRPNLIRPQRLWRTDIRTVRNYKNGGLDRDAWLQLYGSMYNQSTKLYAVATFQRLRCINTCVSYFIGWQSFCNALPLNVGHSQTAALDSLLMTAFCSTLCIVDVRTVLMPPMVYSNCNIHRLSYYYPFRLKHTQRPQAIFRVVQPLNVIRVMTVHTNIITSWFTLS